MRPELAALTLIAAAQTVSYHLVVDGPDGTLDRSCEDPCEIEMVEVVGTGGGRATTTTSTQEDDSDARRGADCRGDCSTGRSTALTINFSPPRTLREGMEVRIRGQRAHFIFYDVVDTDNGRSTRRRHSEFTVDRPLIELELHGNSVRLETTGLTEGDGAGERDD